MDWGNFAQIASAFASLAALLIALWTARNKRNADTFAEIFARLNRQENRIASLEGDLRHLPDKDVVHQLQLSLQDLKGQMAVVIERVGPIKAIAERLQEAMLESGHK